MLKVFLSSTYEDLISERQAVQTALQRMSAQYSAMEHFGSFAQEPLEKCLSKVRTANVLILILGYRYGFVPEGAVISMTESEYREAKAKAIPVLAYLADYKPYSPESCDDIRLWTLKEELKFTRGVSFYKSSEELAWKVVSDLAREYSSHISFFAPPLNKLRNQILTTSIEDHIEELIGILEDRARIIYEEFAPQLEDAWERERLQQFRNLHKRHIKCLRQGTIIQAHELLIQIHHLLAPDPRGIYCRDASALDRVLGDYLAGGSGEGSLYYPRAEWWRVEQSDFTPAASIRLYKNILAQKRNPED